MRPWSTRLATVMVTGLSSAAGLGALLGAQDLGHGPTPAEIERGGQTFLALCATCHGPDGDLLPTANLSTGTFRRATTDQELIAIIRNGIPETPMPPHTLSDTQAALVVAYLRTLPSRARESSLGPIPGNAQNGQVVFDGKGGCRTCHRVDGVGAFLGPDLSSVGLTRRAGELVLALIDPDRDIRVGALTATITAKDGAVTVGRLLNQDTYSIQIIDAGGTLRSFRKASVESWTIPTVSMMPDARKTLSLQEIGDVLAYMATLKAPVPASTGGRRGGGPGAVGLPGGRGAQ